MDKVLLEKLNSDSVLSQDEISTLMDVFRRDTMENFALSEEFCRFCGPAAEVSFPYPDVDLHVLAQKYIAHGVSAGGIAHSCLASLYSFEIKYLDDSFFYPGCFQRIKDVLDMEAIPKDAEYTALTRAVYILAESGLSDELAEYSRMLETALLSFDGNIQLRSLLTLADVYSHCVLTDEYRNTVGHIKELICGCPDMKTAASDAILAASDMSISVSGRTADAKKLADAMIGVQDPGEFTRNISFSILPALAEAEKLLGRDLILSNRDHLRGLCCSLPDRIMLTDILLERDDISEELREDILKERSGLMDAFYSNTAAVSRRGVLSSINTYNQNQQYRKDAMTDSLTGLGSRFAYDHAISSFNNVAPNDLHVVFVDVNGLKETNDRMGHDAGDRLLVRAADTITEVAGDFSSIYRIGGDEFVILMRTDESTALNAVEKLRNSQIGDGTEPGNVSVSFSVGYSSAAESDSFSVRDLVVISDKRMYLDKAAYYNRIGYKRRGNSGSSYSGPERRKHTD